MINNTGHHVAFRYNLKYSLHEVMNFQTSKPVHKDFCHTGQARLIICQMQTWIRYTILVHYYTYIFKMKGNTFQVNECFHSMALY